MSQTTKLALPFPFLRIQFGAARTVHSLLASAARGSRRRAWAQWKQVVAGAAAAERLHGARRAALQRCVRARASHNMRAAWGALQSRVRQSRALVTGATRLQGTLFRARRRALSRRLGVWRSESLAEAIAEGQRQAVREHQHAAVRLLASTARRIKRKRFESGWRALATFAAECRREEGKRASRSERAGLLVQRTLERSRKRELAKVWKAWVGHLTRRRVQGKVDAAVSSLEEEKASLAREVKMLKLGGAVRLIVSSAERSNRCASDLVVFFTLFWKKNAKFRPKGGGTPRRAKNKTQTLHFGLLALFLGVK